ncbi:MAG: TlpA family protein disulfide reductase [Lentisphaeria bacterium]|nr:TlpA family protein disulfide reductase [Candidatus Neomarinimicrobiota bacterium]MCF7841603.1 TlpA family protein disulfide reductase [Lentisphaeria bacterium]
MDETHHHHQIILRTISLLLFLTTGWAAEQSFPSAGLKDLTGSRVEMQSVMEGKLTLVNFWATYCVPCRKEMKILDKLNTKFADQGFQVIGVAIDNPKTAGRVRGLVRSKNLRYTILLDTDQSLYRTFNTNAMPYSVLVDPRGNIVWQHTGYVPGDEIELEKVIISNLTSEDNPHRSDK